MKAKPQPKQFYWKKIIAIFIFHADAWVKCPLFPQAVAKTALNPAVVNVHSFPLLLPFLPLLCIDLVINSPCPTHHLGWSHLYIYPVFLLLSAFL